MKASRLLPVLAASAFAMAGCYVPPQLPAGTEAPPFRGKAQDKEHYSMLDLTRRGPVVVAFLSATGAASRDSLDYLGLFAKGYRGKASVIGVVDLDEDALVPWTQERSVPFPVIPDVDGSIARRYEVESAPTVVLVGRNSAMLDRWTGLTRANLRALNERIGKALESSPARIAVDNAPESAPGVDRLGSQ